jgi:hypothetical protein
LLQKLFFRIWFASAWDRFQVRHQLSLWVSCCLSNRSVLSSSRCDILLWDFPDLHQVLSQALKFFRRVYLSLDP